MLHGRPHGVLDRAAVELANRLKLVQRHHHFAATGFGQPAGQREDVLCEPRDVTLRFHRGKGNGQRAERRLAGRVADLGARRPDGFFEPCARAVPPCFGGHKRSRVALEKADVRAETTDGDVDGQRAAPRDGRERLPDQRRLAVPARGNQEHLLSVVEVADQALQLGRAVDEGGRGHDLAVHEGIPVHYVALRNGYVISRNAGQPARRTGGEGRR